MEVEELLARAWSAVEKAGIPEGLQEYAFKEAIARLSSDAPRLSPPEAAAPAVPPGASGAAAATGEESQTIPATQQTDTQLFEKFSHESGIPVSELERVFYFDGGEPHLNGPKVRLGTNIADQARAVALALTAAYDYARDIQNLSVDIVRAECERLKCDPGGNWAKVMNALTTVNYVGAARKKQLRTKADTPDSLNKLVKSVLGLPAE